MANPPKRNFMLEAKQAKEKGTRRMRATGTPRYSIESVRRGMARTNAGYASVSEQNALNRRLQSWAQEVEDELPEGIRTIRGNRDSRLQSNVTKNTAQAKDVKTSGGSAAPVYSYEDWANTLGPVPQKPKFQGWQSKKEREKEEAADRAAAELFAREEAGAARDAAQREEDLRHEAALRARDEEEAKAQKLRNEMRGVQVPVEQSCTGVNWDIGSERMDNLKFKSFDDVLAKKREIVGERGGAMPSAATSGRGALRAASLGTRSAYFDNDEEMFVPRDPNPEIGMAESYPKTQTMGTTAGPTGAKARSSGRRDAQPSSSVNWDKTPLLRDDGPPNRVLHAGPGSKSRSARQPLPFVMTGRDATFETRDTRKRKLDTESDEKIVKKKFKIPQPILIESSDDEKPSGEAKKSDVISKHHSKAHLEPVLNIQVVPAYPEVRIEGSKIKAEDVKIKQEGIYIKAEKNVAIKTEPGLPAIKTEDVKTKNEAMIGTTPASDNNHYVAFLDYKVEKLRRELMEAEKEARDARAAMKGKK